MEVNITPVDLTKARKRPRLPETWKRVQAKKKRYQAKQLPLLPTCRHVNKSNFKCQEVTKFDVLKMFDGFYSNETKPEQDAFLMKFVRVDKVKRHRRKKTQRTSKFSTQLMIKKSDSPELIQLCQKTFFNILRIPRNRIRRVAECFYNKGNLLKENRGGDHTSHKNVHKLSAVKAFIETFKCVESHYCRSSSERKYLPSTLNIKKMWRMFNNQSEIKVRQCDFRRVFDTNYNISFGTPRTDVCSKCTELIEKNKKETDENVKSQLMIEKKLHNFKTKAFYDLLREKADDMDNDVVISADAKGSQGEICEPPVPESNIMI